MKFLDDDLRVVIFEETQNQERDVSDYFDGIYEVISHGLFDVTFIPQFFRVTNSWYLNAPRDFSDVGSNEEARLIMASVSKCIVTPDNCLAGTKEQFFTPPVDEVSEKYSDDPLQDSDCQTIHYVTPREFYTFRGELATIIAEQETGFRHPIRLDELQEFSFLQFILNHIMTPQQREVISCFSSDKNQNLYGVTNIA